MEQTQLDLFAEGYVKGLFVQEIFYNEENGYGVYLMQVLASSEDINARVITVVGHFLRPHEEEVYTCCGEWKMHPKFGRQYQVSRTVKEMPRTKEAVIKYLSSDLFAGIGKKTAKKIVKHLGVDALDVIAAQPDVLTDIRGLTSAKIQMITDQLHKNHVLEQALIYLYQFGIGSIIAFKIVQTYQQQTISILKDNPYRLVDDIAGIGFHRADEIAKQQGVADDSPTRFQAAVLFVMQEAAYSHGHVFLTEDQLNQQVDALLGISAGELYPYDVRKAYLQMMIDEERMLEEQARYYLPSLYYAEYGLAAKVRQLLEQKVETQFPVAAIYQEIGKVEEEWQISYVEKQREAIITTLSSSFMILTGGPGTGKTTVIRGICQVFSKLHECSIDANDYKKGDKPFPIRLVAPTGRAAKRMSEATGLPAMTIHRLLGWKGDFFEHHADHPIEGMLLIVDEGSMLDIWLTNQLFRSIPKGMQVILVGDPDQLPSVGPGQVLHHLLQVPAIPRVELNEIFRQAEGSSIIRLAHALKQGKVPDDLLLPQSDRRFFSCQREQVIPVVMQTVINAIKKGYTIFDIQVLVPMYKGLVGVDRINQEIQQAINPKNPSKKEISWGEGVFRHGDKVLQLVNHPEHPVYNGDMGIVIAIESQANSDQPVLWVRYDRLEVPYTRTQLQQISLAYACSVHKAQGSEFSIVVFPVLYAYRRMLERNLIYKGVTRSKS
jgi:exodeoxyribonuclease V alpha subunit